MSLTNNLSESDLFAMRLVLEISVGSRTHQIDRIGKNLVIGRGTDCDIQLPDNDAAEFTSARHAALQVDSAQVVLRDLGSTNGTFLNGQRVESPVPIAQGDQLQLGRMGPTARVVVLELAPEEVSRANPAHSADGVQERTSLGGIRRGLRRLRTLDPAKKTQLTIAVTTVAVCVAALTLMLLRTKPTQVTLHSSDQSDRILHSITDSPSPDATVTSDAAVDRPTENASQDANPPPEFRKEGITDALRSSVVWVGFRFQDRLFSDGSGWLINSHQVVTSGRLASRLKNYALHRELDMPDAPVFEPVVWFSERDWSVSEIRVHPLFEESVRGSVAWLQHDVGILVLDIRPGQISTELASEADLRELRDKVDVTVIGFHDPLEADRPYDPIQVKLLEKACAITGAKLQNANAEPCYQLSLPAVPGLDGALVVNRHGRAVGVTGQIGEQSYFVPIRNFRSLLASE